MMTFVSSEVHRVAVGICLENLSLYTLARSGTVFVELYGSGWPPGHVPMNVMRMLVRDYEHELQAHRHRCQNVSQRGVGL
jgi:hypothetical protein